MTVIVSIVAFLVQGPEWHYCFAVCDKTLTQKKKDRKDLPTKITTACLWHMNSTENLPSRTSKDVPRSAQTSHTED